MAFDGYCSKVALGLTQEGTPFLYQVSIASEWLNKLPPRTEEEVEVLKDKTHAKFADPHARLGCQIILEPELEGMVVSIAEEKPWRTL